MKTLIAISGIFLFLGVLTSCHKETKCKCTTTYNDSSIKPSTTYTDGIKGKDGQCWNYEGTGYDWETGAEEYKTECEKL